MRPIKEVADKEMLGLAAKALGVKLHLHVNDVHHFERLLYRNDAQHWAQWAEWNPLLRDGDRHRLQVALKMTVAFEPSRGGWSVGAIVNDEFQWLAFDEREPYAIVRAAAELGRLRGRVGQ